MVRGYILSGNKRGLHLMCRSAYVRGYSKKPVIKSSDYLFGVLMIRKPDGTVTNFMIMDVLKCVSANVGTYFITKGRKDNTVYFLQPLSVDLPEFVLDENFNEDV